MTSEPHSKPKFAWPHYPTDQNSFVVMMEAIDRFLANDKGLDIVARPMHVGFALYDAFGWAGNTFPPPELARLPGFEGDVLRAKAWEWYELTYGDRLKCDHGPGSVVLRMRRASWRLRLPRIFGRATLFIDRNLANEGVRLQKSASDPRASVNVLGQLDGVTQALAHRMTEEELQLILRSTALGLAALENLQGLEGDELFAAAKGDYASSVEALMQDAWANARWSTAQSAEKVIKGLLKRRGVSYPTKGAKGHDIVLLGGLLVGPRGQVVRQELLKRINCSTNVRYGEVLSSAQDALEAHQALLHVLANI